MLKSLYAHELHSQFQIVEEKTKCLHNVYIYTNLYNVCNNCTHNRSTQNFDPLLFF